MKQIARRRTPYILLAPFVLIFFGFIAYPMLYSIVIAMQQTFGPRRSRFVFLDNFTTLLSDPLFWKAMGNTVIFAAGSVLIQLPISLGLAMLLNRKDIRGRVIFRLILFSPVLVGPVFVALIFALIFDKQGLMNQWLHGVFSAFPPDFAWLENFVMGSLILAALWQYAGFNMVYFLAALQNVDREQVEAASIDGANAWQVFINITLPAIRPVGTFVVLLSLIGSFQMFELAWIMFDNTAGPNDQALFVVTYLYQAGFIQNDLGYASAIGWFLALALIGFAVIQRKVAEDKEVSA